MMQPSAVQAGQYAPPTGPPSYPPTSQVSASWLDKGQSQDIVWSIAHLSDQKNLMSNQNRLMSEQYPGLVTIVLELCSGVCVCVCV